MFGQVVDVGRTVTLVKPGDYAVFTVRRGCGTCRPCGIDRSDMCRTGLYAERGIWGLDGYQTEFVVDREPFVVRVAPELDAVALLAGPSRWRKRRFQQPSTSNSLGCRTWRPRSTGSPGNAASSPDWAQSVCSRRCRCACVMPTCEGLDVVDAATARPRWLNRIGGHYVDGRKVTSQHPIDQIGTFDVIVEATGIATLEFDLLDALATNGVYAVTGIPAGDRPADYRRRQNHAPASCCGIRWW